MRQLIPLALALLALILPPRAAMSMLVPREADPNAGPDPAAPWVTVDDEGQPQKTLTPTPTLVDGTTSWIDGAPNQLTAAVFTFTTHGKPTTSTVTGNQPPPTADSKTGKGAFLPCANREGLFCEPSDKDMLNPGNTYYVTWDPEADVLVAAANTTLQLSLRGDYVDTLTGHTSTAFESSMNSPLEWGFLPWTIDASLLNDYPDGIDISLQLRYNRLASVQKTPLEVRRQVTVQWTPRYVPPEAKTPRSVDLLVALPIVGVFVIACVVGTWWWNRDKHRIGLGNVMSRTRFGRASAAKRARKRRLRATMAAAADDDDDGDIALSQRDGGPTEYHQYQDDDNEPSSRARRSAREGNTFRDEIKRQEDETRFY